MPDEAHLILLEHLVLPQGLHGVDLARVGLLHKPDFSERAFTDDFDGLEVLESNTGPAKSKVAKEISHIPVTRTLYVNLLALPSSQS
jgi:hypothetical protein